jgi:hypothetical protein
LVLAAVSGACLASDAEPSDAPRAAAPGAEPYPAALARRLDEALAAKGPGYVPRTRHVDERGAPRFTNRLILETSPYLAQHAHNPVDWYPWGDEAFETARRLGRPVLLSIGYSTCHWCHVMEEESFEDLEIAAYLNANYVAIKVDREERPDLDSIYMSAVQMLTGSGGWPMTTWLTPDREPFFGGTYFPPRDGDRGDRRGFLTLLRELRRVYDEQPERVAEQAREIGERIATRLLPAPGEVVPGVEAIDAALRRYRDAYDPVHGGLARAPKFPSSLPLRLLMRRHVAAGDDDLREMALSTLEHMARGGIYDQVGGGFHRYSTDRLWLVPHFEKMLYDNALLTWAYLDGYRLGGREEPARIARETLRYVAREMTAPGGAFYSATDADSLTPDGHREEGWFFTWTPGELVRVLGEEEAAFVGRHYGVSEAGNFEGRNILHVATPWEAADAAGAPRDRLDRARAKLYRARSSRPAPLRDDKILTAWNGLMISAFARAGFVLDERELLERAEGAAAFVLERLRVDGRLRRAFKDGRAPQDGFLEDYAFLIQGLLDLYESSGTIGWLREAIALEEVLDAHYLDAESGGYFLTADDHERLLAREKPAYDGAEPSGNSVAAMNLLRLRELTGDAAYGDRADALLRAFAGELRRNPLALSEMLLAIDFRASSPLEVVIVTREPGADAAPLLDVLRENYLPNHVLARVAQPEIEAALDTLTMLRGKVARDGRPTAYVCQEGVCRLPTTDPALFLEQLRGRPLVAPSSEVSPNPRKK